MTQAPAKPPVKVSYLKWYPRDGPSPKKDVPFYYYIKNGAMDIHVKLSIVFGVVHVLVAKCFYITLTNPTTANLYTVLWSM